MPGALDDTRRSTVARHATLPTPTALSSFLKILGISLSVLLVSAIAVGGFVAADILNRTGDGARPQQRIVAHIRGYNEGLRPHA